MTCFRINGGAALDGDVKCQGSKNASLPMLAACILTKDETALYNVPALTDVEAALDILRYLGAKVKREDGALIVDAAGIGKNDVPDALMREMRSSVIFLGPLLARTGRAVLSAPGGCEIGLRPIDLHLEAVSRLGAAVKNEGGKIVCTAPKGLAGAEIPLSFPSVGATENAMLAAVLAKGETRILNAAREPEIADLAALLNAMGAHIRGAGESTICIDGVNTLAGAVHTVLPDRIWGATLLTAGAITKGRVCVKGLSPVHLVPVLDVLERAGCEIRRGKNEITVSAPRRLHSVRTVRTTPYPGFPTDAQPPVTALLSTARGVSVIMETVFESRFRYVGELTRFGASIRTDGGFAVVEGVPRLYGAEVSAPDLRGGAALTLAALCAEGESTVREARHIDRGYEDLAASLRALGADVRRMEEQGK